MAQAAIQNRLFDSSARITGQTSKRCCDLLVVVGDEQTKAWQIVDRSNRSQIRQNAVTRVGLPH